MSPPVGAARAGVVGSKTSAIPDSVVYQYVAENFASPWPDEIGSADMSINGPVSSTFSNGEDSVFGDGGDDFGTATGPETLPTNETFGVALTLEYVAEGGFQSFTASDDKQGTEGGNTFAIQEDGNGPSGNISLFLREEVNGNQIQVNTDSDYSGSPRAIIINKSGNTASDIDIYVDDMSTAVSTTTQTDSGFDHTNYAQVSDQGFFARNNDDAPEVDLYAETEAGVFEFNTEPYTQSEREAFVSRRPEV